MTAGGCGRTGGPCAGTGDPGLDELLDGGFPRGHLSEVVGSGGAMLATVMTRVLMAGTARGEAVALIDPGDRFVPASGAASGLDLSSLLWVRGHGAARSRDASPAISQALAALELVIDSGDFGVAVLDFSYVPVQQLRQLPAATWTHLFRRLAAGNTSALMLGPEPAARSAEGRVLMLRPSSESAGRTGQDGANRRGRSHTQDRQDAGSAPSPGAWEARVVQAHRASDAFVVCQEDRRHVARQGVRNFGRGCC